MAEGNPDSISEEAQGLSVGNLWKGENDSDVEQMESYDSNPLANAEAWTEDETYTIYREKLVRLRSLYTGQLARLKHSLAERRREYLLEWMAAGGDKEEARYPSQGGSLKDAAYRSYRRRSGEEAVLQRKYKQRQIAASIEFFSRKDMRNSSRAHYHHLMRLQSQHGPPQHPPCSNLNCDNRCLPFATRCRRRILHVMTGNSRSVFLGTP